MLKFDIITIFPEIFDSYLKESIIGRAVKKRLIAVGIRNPRDFTASGRGRVDDRPYGGGPGMVMQIQPIIKAVEFAKSKIKDQKSKIKVILFSPAGKLFDNKIAAKLAKNYDNLILICGRYEGVDARLKPVIKGLKLETLELSAGPYVLTGGELPAMVLIDAITRRLPGALGKGESVEERRLGIGVPVYTRPAVFQLEGKKYRVPRVLLSGDHKKIEEWRKKFPKQ